MPPVGVLPMPGGGALWVEAGDGLAVQSPLRRRPVQDKIPCRKSPLQALENFHLTRCRLSNAWRKLSFKTFYMSRRGAAGKVGCC